MYYPALIIRWFLTSLILLKLKDNPALQIIFLMIISIIQQAYTIKQHPHEDKKTHAMTLFIEIVGVTGYLLGLIGVVSNAAGDKN
jgi:hypothetical protein